MHHDQNNFQQNYPKVKKEKKRARKMACHCPYPLSYENKATLSPPLAKVKFG